MTATDTPDPTTLIHLSQLTTLARVAEDLTEVFASLSDHTARIDQFGQLQQAQPLNLLRRAVESLVSDIESTVDDIRQQHRQRANVSGGVR